MPNIYIELELSTNPAITNVSKLKEHLNGKISEWEMKRNNLCLPETVRARYQNLVHVAKNYIANNFGNLQQQAEDVRVQKREELRQEIEFLVNCNGASEKDIKKIISKFEKYILQEEITGEIGKKLRQFVHPKQIVDLKYENSVSYERMCNINQLISSARNHKDFVNRNWENLYTILGETPKTPSAILLKKSQDISIEIQGLYPKDKMVTALSQLSTILVECFGDDVMYEKYKVALKRRPFDQMANQPDGIFLIRVNPHNDDKKVNWQEYQKSIDETLQLQYSQEEAEWLVYEFYCVTRNCILPEWVPILPTMNADPPPPIGSTKDTPPQIKEQPLPMPDPSNIDSDIFISPEERRITILVWEVVQFKPHDEEKKAELLRIYEQLIQRCFDRARQKSLNQSSKVRYWGFAAYLGNPDAHSLLGKHYITVGNQKKEAVKHLKAASQCIVDAQFLLGLCYHEGYGVPQDIQKAEEYLEQAAKQNHAKAQLLLGLLCYQNNNMNRAAKLFENLTASGDTDAKFNLGICYYHGIGVEKNVARTLSLCREHKNFKSDKETYKIFLKTLLTQGIRDAFDADKIIRMIAGFIVVIRGMIYAKSILDGSADHEWCHDLLNKYYLSNLQMVGDFHPKNYI